MPDGCVASGPKVLGHAGSMCRIGSGGPASWPHEAANWPSGRLGAWDEAADVNALGSGAVRRRASIELQQVNTDRFTFFSVEHDLRLIRRKIRSRVLERRRWMRELPEPAPVRVHRV